MIAKKWSTRYDGPLTAMRIRYLINVFLSNSATLVQFLQTITNILFSSIL